MEAGKGDAILISADRKNILIDGGYKTTYKKKIRQELEDIDKSHEALDLVILTHFDADHVQGLIALVEDKKHSLLIKEIWFNQFSALDRPIYTNNHELSSSQAINLEKAVCSLKERNPNLIVKNKIDTELMGERISLTTDLQIDVLSPSPIKLQELAENYKDELDVQPNTNLSGESNDREIEFSKLWNNPDLPDTSSSNGSSIAIRMLYRNNNYLFLGDAHIKTITDSLIDKGYTHAKKAQFNFIKLSHHGSKFNISNDFLKIIECKNFYISGRRGY